MRIASFLIFAFLFIDAAQASPTYWEVGTSLGAISSGASYFKQAAADTTSGTFILGLSLFTPLTNENNFAHLELGLSNRITTASAAGSSIAMGTVSPSLRVEIYRFYFGGGYSPLNFLAPPGSGMTSLRINSGATSYYGEAGAIWRVVPELQITATVAEEFARPSGGGTTAMITEYGLHFRFPFDARDTSGGGGVKWDGFRYPFGFMK